MLTGFYRKLHGEVSSHFEHLGLGNTPDLLGIDDSAFCGSKLALNYELLHKFVSHITDYRPELTSYY